jgi:hypothetical protein
VRGRHGSCSCASQTNSGSSARTRCRPSVGGSSNSPNHTATSPPTMTGRAQVSTTTICMPGVWPGAGTSGAGATARARLRPARTARRAPRPTREWCSRPRCARRPAPDAGHRSTCRRRGGCRHSGRRAGVC